MSVPKKRRTKSSVNQRRSHFALKRKTLAVCPQCKRTILPHTACRNCGYYKGREVIKLKVRSKK